MCAKILLTTFYGQLLAIAFYDLIIYGTSDWKFNGTSDSHFNISRLVLGAAMIVCSVFSLVVMWMDHLRTLFLSGMLLSFIFAAYALVYAIFLTSNYPLIAAHDKYPLVASIVCKTLIMAIGTFLTFYVSTRQKKKVFENIRL
jgi:hypothetical protein